MTPQWRQARDILLQNNPPIGTVIVWHDGTSGVVISGTDPRVNGRTRDTFNGKAIWLTHYKNGNIYNELAMGLLGSLAKIDGEDVVSNICINCNRNEIEPAYYPEAKTVKLCSNCFAIKKQWKESTGVR